MSPLAWPLLLPRSRQREQGETIIPPCFLLRFADTPRPRAGAAPAETGRSSGPQSPLETGQLLRPQEGPNRTELLGDVEIRSGRISSGWLLRLNREDGGGPVCRQAENGPRGRSGRRSAVLGGERHTGLIHPGWPTPARHCSAIVATTVGSTTFSATPSTTRSNSSWRRSRCTAGPRQVPPFTGLFSGLEPEGAVEPECADPRHMRGPIPIDRRQPAGVRSGPPVPGAGHATYETVLIHTRLMIGRL